MRVDLRGHGLAHSFHVEGTVDDSTTVGDLVERMVSHLVGEQIDHSIPVADRNVTVDGVRTDVESGIVDAGVVDGSVIDIDRGHDLAGVRLDSPMTIGVTGGLTAGNRFPVHGRRLIVGRANDADLRVDAPTVDPYHLALDPALPGIRLTDLDSMNGTLIDGEWLLESDVVGAGSLIDLGAAHLMIRTAVDDTPDNLLRARTAAGTLSLNRPPRTLPPSPSPQIDLPVDTPPVAISALFSWAGLLVPLVLGGLMAWLADPLWALFALLGPVMMIGSWLEGRRRSTKARRGNRHALSEALEHLDSELDDRSRAELARLRSRHPDPAEIVRRVFQPSTTLWQRRLHHNDAMELLIGTGDVEWHLEAHGDGPPAPAALELLAERTRLHGAPVVAPARPGDVIGLAGDRRAALAVARALVVQAAVHHGPADLELAVLADSDRSGDWRWVGWLPHSCISAGRGRRRTLAFGDSAIAELATDLIGASQPAAAAVDRLLLCVVDGEALSTARGAPARALMAGSAGPVAGIVIASSRDRLPHSCTTVVEVVDPDGLGRAASLATGSVHDVLLSGMSSELATRTARHLARFADPEVDLTEAAIPPSVSLLEALGMTDPTPDSVALRWSEARGTASLAVPIGADGLGPLTIDLVCDGPHALVGGTTGSGKSELLRSLIAGLAAGYDANQLNFVLIDYKGGSAFDTCARLPHTVGLVTDLDEHLGARALRCLESELHHRERVLRAAAVADIADYHSAIDTRSVAEPLPRLVVVIDEFATMAAELPDFLDALVGIAQRGRSLGVHLVVATQRPSGAVSPNIRTNTNLRIALRVLDSADSSDVIDCADAAGISRDQPGRGYVRLGPVEVAPFQSAFVGGHTRPGDDDSLKVTSANDQARRADAEPDGPRDLDRLVTAIGTAHARQGLGDPRRPWPEPLPDNIDLASLPGSALAEGVVIGLADEPDQQRQTPAVWNPAAGNALLLGTPGSGTTTALAAIVCAFADHHPPDALHVYGIDQGAGELRTLESLPHVGSIIDASAPDRQLRLIRRLDDERRRRAALGPERLAAQTRLVLAIDGYGSWRDGLESDRHHAAIDAFLRVYSDGPPLGIHCVLTGDHAGAVNRQVLATTSQTWLFRMADSSDYLAFGLRVAPSATMPPGRAFQSESGREVQFALAHVDGLATAVRQLAARSEAMAGAPTVGELPVEIAMNDLDATAKLGCPTWLPVGLGDDDLVAVGLELHVGEHALIAGRARTGKTTSLRAMSQTLSASGVRVVALAPSRSALLAEPGVAVACTSVVEALTAVSTSSQLPTFLLIDDAEAIDDVSGSLAAAAALTDHPDVPFHIVAAGRTERLLESFGHWTAALRSSRVGVLLCPEVLDGDLFSIQLPARSEIPPLPGRGWLVSGGNRQVCQMAMASTSPDTVVERLDGSEPTGGPKPVPAIDADEQRRAQTSRETRSL